MTKKQLVIYILSKNEELLNWYAKYHSFTLEKAEDVYNDSYSKYGTGHLGELSDLIIEDGIWYGVINESNLDELTTD